MYVNAVVDENLCTSSYMSNSAFCLIVELLLSLTIYFPSVSLSPSFSLPACSVLASLAYSYFKYQEQQESQRQKAMVTDPASQVEGQTNNTSNNNNDTSKQ